MQSLNEIGPMVLEKKSFNVVNAFSLCRYYLPLEKGVALYLYKLDYPFTKVWLKLAQRLIKERWKCEKLTGGQTDNRRSEKLTLAFSSGELKN